MMGFVGKLSLAIQIAGDLISVSAKVHQLSMSRGFELFKLRLNFSQALKHQLFDCNIRVLAPRPFGLAARLCSADRLGSVNLSEIVTVFV